MSQMNEQSTRRSSDYQWPDNAIPKRWVEALFSKMSAFYGSKFADMWRGTDTNEVQKAWSVELWKLSSAQLKSGVDNLTAFNRPPSLPEFIEHCKRSRAEAAAQTAPRLESGVVADKEVIASNLKKLRSITGSMKLQSAHPGWAYDFFIRGTAKNSSSVTVEVWGHCRDAILSPVGRAYPNTQEGNRAKQCYEILRRVSENPGGAMV